jgi:hypothetical protein
MAEPLRRAQLGHAVLDGEVAVASCLRVAEGGTVVWMDSHRDGPVALDEQTRESSGETGKRLGQVGVGG